MGGVGLQNRMQKKFFCELYLVERLFVSYLQYAAIYYLKQKDSKGA